MTHVALMGRPKSNAEVPKSKCRSRSRTPKCCGSRARTNRNDGRATRRIYGIRVMTAESTEGGATIEPAAEDERVNFATVRDVTVEDARRGIVTRSSVPRLLLSPTIDDASSNLAGARKLLTLFSEKRRIYWHSIGQREGIGFET